MAVLGIWDSSIGNDWPLQYRHGRRDGEYDDARIPRPAVDSQPGPDRTVLAPTDVDKII